MLQCKHVSIELQHDNSPLELKDFKQGCQAHLDDLE